MEFISVSFMLVVEFNQLLTVIVYVFEETAITVISSLFHCDCNAARNIYV